jgi:hypothetical protein
MTGGISTAATDISTSAGIETSRHAPDLLTGHGKSG